MSIHLSVNLKTRPSQNPAYQISCLIKQNYQVMRLFELNFDTDCGEQTESYETSAFDQRNVMDIVLCSKSKPLVLNSENCKIQ